jgi:hypothetical protein
MWSFNTYPTKMVKHEIYAVKDYLAEASLVPGGIEDTFLIACTHDTRI